MTAELAKLIVSMQSKQSSAAYDALDAIGSEDLAEAVAKARRQVTAKADNGPVPDAMLERIRKSVNQSTKGGKSLF